MTQIIDAESATFSDILAAHQQRQSQVATKAAEAEKVRDLEVLEAVAQYSPDSIVRGFADLKLSFATAVGQLAEQLTTETDKLDDLKRAIAVENQRLQTLQQTRVVADALYVLNQSHQQNLSQLQARVATAQDTLDQEKTATQRQWQQEQADFEQRTNGQTQLLSEDRQRQEEDYQYETERSRTISNDDYAEARRQVEREIQFTQQTKEKQWSEREAILVANQEKLADYHAQAEAFPQELAAAVQEAREASIKETHDAAKVKANLLEKAWESTQQGYELTIQSLEAKVEQQSTEITALSTQLQTAMEQAQSLAMRAFADSSRQLTAAPTTEAAAS